MKFNINKCSASLPYLHKRNTVKLIVYNEAVKELFKNSQTLQNNTTCINNYTFCLHNIFSCVVFVLIHQYPGDRVAQIRGSFNLKLQICN